MKRMPWLIVVLITACSRPSTQNTAAPPQNGEPVAVVVDEVTRAITQSAASPTSTATAGVRADKLTIWFPPEKLPIVVTREIEHPPILKSDYGVIAFPWQDMSPYLSPSTP